MRRLIVPLTLSLAAAASGFACSSEPDPGQGLAGGATGKGGSSTGVGGSTAATGGSSTGSGGSVSVGTGGVIGVGNSSGSSGSAGSGITGTAGACTGTTATGQKGDGAVVLFLVDTSLSMADAPGGTMGGRGMGGGGMSKMALTQTALNSAFMTLDPSLNVGLVFFPHVAANTMPCFDAQVEVPIAPLAAAQLTLLTTQVSGVTADGSTPTHDAFAFAVETLRATTAQGDKYIVLITDGEPSYTLGCVGTGMPGQMLNNQPLIDAAGAAFTTDGIKTFVVGSPGSENARSSLSAMARLGGTGPAGCMDTGTPAYCHFDMTQNTANFSASLSEALGMISAQIPVDCAFDLPRPPAGMTLDLNQIDITVTDDNGAMTAIGRDPAGDCATDGWVYVGNPPTGVKLCGALCDSVNAQPGAAIEVKYGCGQRVNPPR